MALTQSGDVGRPNLSISASDSNAAGDAWLLPGRGSGIGRNVSKVTMQVAEVNSGAYTSININLEGSVNGTNWDILDSFTTALTALASNSISSPTEGYNYFRANKTTSVTASGTPKVTVNLSFGA